MKDIFGKKHFSEEENKHCLLFKEKLKRKE
jgi:hypothetical protein